MTGVVHDRRYRRREPRGGLRRLRALPIARETLRVVLVRRALLLLLGLSSIPFVLAAGGLVLVSRVPEMATALPPIAELYARYMGVEALFAVLLIVWAGSGLVADDLRTGALLVYLSRPLTRADYVLGKLLPLVALSFSVMAAPPLALWTVGAALDPQGLSVRGSILIPLAILVQSGLVAVALSALTLGASAAVRSGPLAGLLVVGVLVIGGGAATVAPEAARPLLRLLSIPGDLMSVGRFVFGVAPAPEAVHWGAALVFLAAIVAAAAATLWRRVRAVEVVG